VEANRLFREKLQNTLSLFSHEDTDASAPRRPIRIACDDKKNTALQKYKDDLVNDEFLPAGR
jgi:hypothetical protein